MTVLKLLASKDEPLLVWGDALLVLDLGFDIVNGVRALDLKSDGLAGQGLNKDLHLFQTKKTIIRKLANMSLCKEMACISAN